MFLLSFFSFLAPEYKIYAGTHMATTVYFYYLLLAYCMIYFTEMRNYKKGITHKRQDNETHYSGVVFGALLGVIVRRRLLRHLKA